MSEQKKQIKMGIDNGEDFYAHELSINFSPIQFIFDFRCVTPRTDPRTRDGPFLSLKHNVVMVDAWHAIRIHEVLGNMIKEYEKQYGKIEKTKAMQKHEKEIEKVTTPQGKDKNSKEKSTKETMPNYFG